MTAPLITGTPANHWASTGDPDPHDDRYNVERSNLTMGDYTDDELANAVYLYGNAKPRLEDIESGKGFLPIVYLTAAKDRIRWLSRRLTDALTEGQKLRRVMTDAACLLREYEAYHRAKETEDSLAKAERNRVMAEQLESCIERKESTL